MSDSPLDAFMPAFDVRERHAVVVRAPAAVVFDIASALNWQSLPLVHALFWARAKLMGATPVARKDRGFIGEIRSLGWGSLVERPGEMLVFGASCRPWLADVVFSPIPAGRFSAFAEPGQVKIAWTIECHALGPGRTELVSETRAVATDDDSRRRFLAYWRWARFGIITIRWLLLPAIRRQAEARVIAS